MQNGNLSIGSRFILHFGNSEAKTQTYVPMPQSCHGRMAVVPLFNPTQTFPPLEVCEIPCGSNNASMQPIQMPKTSEPARNTRKNNRQKATNTNNPTQKHHTEKLHHTQQQGSLTLFVLGLVSFDLTIRRNGTVGRCWRVYC